MFPPLGKKHTTALPEIVEHETIIHTLHRSRHQSNNVRLVIITACSLLILVLLLYVSNFLTLASTNMLALTLLGIACMGSGIRSSSDSMLVPGGIFSGIGMGFLLTAGPFHLVSGDMAVSLFLFVCGLGWFSISILSKLYTRHTQWWPLIPGGMMAVTSLLLFFV